MAAPARLCRHGAAVLLALTAASPAAAQSGGYPPLLPLGGLLAQEDGGVLRADGAAGLAARAGRLASRAAALRSRTAMDAETRARLAALTERAAALAGGD